jgi:hypothetical protein
VGVFPDLIGNIILTDSCETLAPIQLFFDARVISHFLLLHCSVIRAAKSFCKMTELGHGRKGVGGERAARTRLSAPAGGRRLGGGRG